MFEHRTQPLLSLRHFIHRLFWGLGVVALLVSFSLFLGTLGYRWTENMGWVDAFYNASLILSGMGPADTLNTDTGKIFASVYSLYSGIVLIATTGILLAPLFHRIIHKFHSDTL
ncbi:MAG: hypothetical protein AAB276_05260 [Pseudomonadota bacterium]